MAHDVDLPEIQFPARQEIEVLPADVPKEHVLGFRIKEYNGSAVRYRTAEGFGEIVSGLEDLKPGMEVVAWESMLITVTEVTGSKAEGQSGGALVFLEHGADDRHCWVAWGAANLRGVTKLQITTEPEGTS